MGVKQEKARQSCWCWTSTGREMAPVKKQEQNTRTHKMLEEATGFSKRLASCESQIKALKKAVDGMITISEKILSQPLPKIWDKDMSGSVSAVVESGTPLTNAGQLQRSHSTELQGKVLDPIGSWQKEYTRMKHQVAKLDQQGLRVDEARRAFYKTQQQHLKENVMKTDNISAAGPAEEGDERLVAARAQYEKLELEVWLEMKQLLSNARNVQEYLTRAMALQGDTLAAAASTHAQPRSPGASMVGSVAGGAPTAPKQQAVGGSSLAGSAEFNSATGGGSFSPTTPVNQSYGTTA